MALLQSFIGFLCLFNFVEFSSAKNILFFHLAATASHRTSIWPLTERLANQGHNITYIFPVKERFASHPNIEEITPSTAAALVARVSGEIDLKMRLNGTIAQLYSDAFKYCFDICVAFYNSPETQEWLQRPGLHYDLILIDSSLSQCAYGLVHKFKAKHVIFMPVLMPQHPDVYGTLLDLSSIPPIFSIWGPQSKPSQIGLYDKTMSMIEGLLWYFGNVYFLRSLKPLIEQNLNVTELPDLSEFDRNTSLVLINSNFVDDYPIALPPLFVSYSGLWCSRDKIKHRAKIPEDLDEFIGNSSAMYISFGTAISSGSMPDEMKKDFLEAFEMFPELKFLWRWDGIVPDNKPKNVIMRKRFPQPDLLADHRVKAFMTQAGRPSTQEALCHAVPLITIPVFGDQDYNSHRLEYIDAAIHLDIESITKPVLIQTIKEIVYNKKYKKRMAELSSMYNDRPIDPLDNAAYWVEYVLRHDTSLMRPLGMDRTWYERRFLDVYAVATLIVSGTIAVTFFGLAKISRFFICSKKYKSE